jgi:AcrR family transcriptional regulator
MSPRKTYSTALRSKSRIRSAFLELLHEKNFEKITVTDIVSRANINRSTFYAHYPDMIGLLDEIQEEIIARTQQIFEEADYTEIYHSPKEFLRKLIRIGTENRELFALLGTSPLASRHLDQIKTTLLQNAISVRTLPDDPRTDLCYAIHTNFFIGGIAHTVRQWISGELECSEEELLDLLTDVIVRTIETK